MCDTTISSSTATSSYNWLGSYVDQHGQSGEGSLMEGAIYTPPINTTTIVETVNQSNQESSTYKIEMQLNELC